MSDERMKPWARKITDEEYAVAVGNRPPDRLVSVPGHGGEFFKQQFVNSTLRPVDVEVAEQAIDAIALNPAATPSERMKQLRELEMSIAVHMEQLTEQGGAF